MNRIHTLLAVLSAKTKPAVASAYMAVSAKAKPAIATAYMVLMVLVRRISAGLCLVRDRVVNMLPDGLRRRLGTRRSAVIGLVALGLLTATVAQTIGTGAASDAKSVQPAAKAPASVGAPPAQADPAPPQLPTAPVPAPAPAPAPEPAQPAPVPAGVTPSQVENAKAIAQVAAERGLPKQAVTVGLATALQESQLENINYGDRDSVGLFQQRPSQGWGSVEQILNPHYAAGKFYDGLVNVPGWENMRVTDAAQTVQRSAFPDAYQKWVPLAGALADAVTPTK